MGLKIYVLISALVLCGLVCLIKDVVSEKSNAAIISDQRLAPYNFDIEKAVKIFLSKKNVIDTMPEFSDARMAEILSIVFPETIRWNNFQDVVEYSLDRTIYVQYGSNDCSIGIFQMKPTFIEQLEDYVVKHNISECDFVKIGQGSTEKIRQERVNRLSQDYWQFKYAYAFWIIAKHRFKAKKFHDTNEQLHFFATAYNYGFCEPDKDIAAWQKKSVFPFGRRYKGKQVAYGDLSVFFYEEFSKFY